MSCLRYVLILLISTFFVQAGVSQNHPESKKILEQGQAAADSGNYPLAIKLVESAIDKEFSHETPDTVFLGLVYRALGLMKISHADVNEGYHEYLKSIEFLEPRDPESLEGLASQMVLAWTLIETREDEIDLRPTGDKEHLFYAVDSVLGRSGDTVWVRIKAGGWDGVEVGGSAAVLSSYWSLESFLNERPADPSEISENDLGDRGNKEIAKGVIESAGLYTSIARLTLLYPSDPAYETWFKDNVQVKVNTYPNVYKSILQQLGELNIFFYDLSKQPMYSMRHLRHGDSREIERVVLKQLVADVLETAEVIRDIPEEDWSEAWKQPIPAGRFAGLNIIEAMEQTNLYDVYGFLDFVQAYPGKYMGKNWKINETYATWVINDTPEGENFENWIIDELKRLDERGEIDSVLPVIEYYLGDSVLLKYNNRLNEFFGAEESDQALKWADLQVSIGEILNDTNWIHDGWNNVGFAYSQQENHLKAIEFYTKILRQDKDNANARYNRSGAYYDMEQYDLAIADMQVVVDQFPDWADGYGSMGWYYMLDGNLDKSWEYTRKAYALDSLSRAWSVNLGHLHLFNNEPEKARPYYRQALELLESEEEYEFGLKRDFEIFLEKGWHTSLVNKQKEWAEAQYQTVYHPYLKAAESHTRGKELEDEGKYLEALAYFEEAKKEELKSTHPRKDWIHVYSTWAGYCHQELGNWADGVRYYEYALSLAREESDEDLVVDDLELLGWLYRDKGDKAKSDAYYEEAASLQRRLDDQKKSNSLYILSIGINNNIDLQFNYAETDAKVVADLLEEKSRALFDYTYKTTLTGSKASRSMIEAAFQEIISKSKPGDSFILFFAGQSTQQEDNFYFVPSGLASSDTTNLESKAISANLLRTWVNSMQASKQYMILDAAATSFINTYVRLISLEQGLLELDKDIMLFSPFTPRIEKPALGHSVLVSNLVNGLNGAANLNVPNDSMITAREMDAFLFKALGNKKYYYRNQSYAHGMDFKLAYAQKSSFTGIDTSAPEIVIIDPTATRGGMVETSEQSIQLQGKIFDVSALSSVTLNGKEIELTQNGKFAVDLSLRLGVNKYVVIAQDAKGNVGQDSIQVKRIQQQASNRKTTISFGAREGVDIALLFATDEYDEWNNLSNPVRDAEAIQKDLEELYGFKVELVLNPTRKEILEYIRRYQARTYNDNDRLFMFFAGHGVYDEVSKEGYIVAKDSKKDEEIKDFSYVPYSYLRDNVNNIPCRHIMLVMDVCFGGTFDKRSLGSRGDYQMSSEEKEAFIQRTLRTKTRLFMTSGGKEYVPDGRPGSHSPFATRLLEALRVAGPGNGLLTFHDLITAVESLKTTPRYGDFGDNEPGSNFVFNYQQKTAESIVQKEAF